MKTVHFCPKRRTFLGESLGSGRRFRRWSLVVLPIGALLLCAIVFSHCSAPDEPGWNGRSLSVWLVDLNSLSPGRAAMATHALREIGTNAIPFLVDRLRGPDVASRGVVGELEKLFQSTLKRHATIGGRSTEIVRAFRVLGTNGGSSVESLNSLLLRSARDKDSAIATAQAMAAAGPVAKPYLASALESPNRDVRYGALVALVVDFGADAGEVTPQIAEMMRDTNGDIRELALYFLSRFAPDDSGRTAILSQALKDSDPRVRKLASIELERTNVGRANE